MLAQVLQTLLPKELSYQLLLTLIEQYRESSASDLELVLDGKHDFGLGKELAIRTTPKVH
ncbi:MAG: hypothetical protein Q4B28_05455 [bacterium]|nr:hypothetical protein [bacterium]